jgi:hypothetical protein
VNFEFLIQKRVNSILVLNIFLDTTNNLMLKQFRHLYPQGSLLSELIELDRGLYIVRVSVEDRGTILGTGLAAAETVEKAEDRARERALMTIILENILEKKLDSPEKPLTNPQIEQPQPVSSQTVLAPIPQKDNYYNSPVVQSPTKEPAIFEPISPPEFEDFVALETEEITPATTPFVESQINIFDQPITSSVTEETELVETETTVELDFNEIRHKIDLEMKRLNWTKEQGRDFLVNTYGKRSRLHLTDDELLEFWHYLETLSN